MVMVPLQPFRTMWHVSLYTHSHLHLLPADSTTADSESAQAQFSHILHKASLALVCPYIMPTYYFPVARLFIQFPEIMFVDWEEVNTKQPCARTQVSCGGVNPEMDHLRKDLAVSILRWIISGLTLEMMTESPRRNSLLMD